MKVVLTILMITIGVFALVTGAVLAQSGNDLFQQALVKERTEGNLPEAIKLYQTIVQKYRADRKLAAKALFQMGQAYEKLGNAEARNAYERVAREFADQKEVAADAGRRLAALNVPPISDAHSPRLVMSPADKSDETSISLDGRSMALTRWFADGVTSELAVQDMPTGQLKRLVLGGCTSASKSCGFPESAVWSADSRQIAYTWYDDTPVSREELRVVANETGAKQRVLLSNPELSIWPMAWAPDGKSILVAVMHESDRTWQLGWVSLTDGNLKVLKSLEWRFQFLGLAASLSPDGRYVAYSALATNPKQPPPRAADSTDTHIYIVAADGSSEVEVVKTAAVNRFPVWTPDGAHIVFTSNLSGKTDLWSVAMRNGRAAGSPSLVMRDVGEIRPAGMTRSGSYYFRKTKEGVEQASIAELAPGGVSRTLESFVGINPAWSPDGKSLAFKRHSTQFNAFDIVVRSLVTGEERVIGHTGIRADPPRWLHEKTGFLTLVGDAWHFLDLKTEAFTQIAQRGSVRTGVAALAPDDKTLYVASPEPNTSNGWDHIMAIDLPTGQARPIFRLPETVALNQGAEAGGAGLAIALSPDGRTLAINCRTRGEVRLALVHADGSDYREIYSFKALRVSDKLAWTNDGRKIVFATSGSMNGDWQIMRIGVDGGKPEFTGLTVKALSTFDLSPDGSRIAYSTTAAGTSTDELLVIDNLAGLLKDSK